MCVNQGMTVSLRDSLRSRLPLSFGVSGALGSRLYASAETERLIAIARDEGVSIFDTSPSYGAGLAELRLGRAIGNDPDAFIMTKAGLKSSGLIRRERDHSPAGIEQSVDGSLQRLKRDRIDLLWLHGPDRTELTDDLFEVLMSMKAKGKVAGFGITSRDPSLMEFANHHPFSAYMGPANPHQNHLANGDTDAVLFGIECFAGVAPSKVDHLRRSGLWRMAKTIVRGKSPIARDMTAKAAFDYAFNSAKCDVVLTTSTKASRIRENAELCAGFSRLDCAKSIETVVRKPFQLEVEAPVLTMI